MADELIKEHAREAFTNALAVGRRYAGELAESDDFFKPVVMAMAIQDIRNAMTPEAMAAIKGLAGSSMGFLTDAKHGEQYSIDVIRECVIEAMLRGVGVVGNQFNIIGGRFYVARNGWEAKLRKAGCSQIVPTVGRPEDVREGEKNKNGFAKFTAVFGAQATCMKAGQRVPVSACLADGIDGRIEASAFGRDLSDALAGMKGKVEARILKKLYCIACDAMEPDDEGDASNVIVIEAEPEKLTTASPAKPVVPEREITQRERDRLAFDLTYGGAQKRIQDAKQREIYNAHWAEIDKATNKEQLRLLWDAMQKTLVKDIGKKNVDELCHYARWVAVVLPETQVS